MQHLSPLNAEASDIICTILSKSYAIYSIEGNFNFGCTGAWYGPVAIFVGASFAEQPALVLEVMLSVGVSFAVLTLPVVQKPWTSSSIVVSSQFHSDLYCRQPSLVETLAQKSASLSMELLF